MYEHWFGVCVPSIFIRMHTTAKSMDIIEFVCNQRCWLCLFGWLVFMFRFSNIKDKRLWVTFAFDIQCIFHQHHPQLNIPNQLYEHPNVHPCSRNRLRMFVCVCVTNTPFVYRMHGGTTSRRLYIHTYTHHPHVHTNTRTLWSCCCCCCFCSYLCFGVLLFWLTGFATAAAAACIILNDQLTRRRGSLARFQVILISVASTQSHRAHFSWPPKPHTTTLLHWGSHTNTLAKPVLAVCSHFVRIRHRIRTQSVTSVCSVHKWNNVE